MKATEHTNNNAPANTAGAPDPSTRLNELAQARFQELGLMCQRRRALQEEMTAVDRRIDELNSEIQGIGAAFGAIAEPAPDVPQLTRAQ